MSTYPVRCEETIWITLSDGCRLAARIWFPQGTGPVPAILEYLPYRRRDRHRSDDMATHPALAAGGYVCVRVDMRGAGDSDGIMRDEYTPQEWADAVELIDWIARQPFCDGSVGMMGLSWSGFNTLQVAALAPPALKAIVSTCASDDRYGDDMHYMGGCLLNDNLQYGSTLFTWIGTPPDPVIVGDRWSQMWLDRLETVTPPALRWMQNATRNAYWKSGSVCENHDAIKVPLLAVGGWADGYTNAVMRLLSGVKGPRKGLIGPWAHAYPHLATPGPAVDFIGYLLRWWDHWLKDHDTGIMAEPMLTCWLQESEAPRPSYAVRKGRWIAEDHWPPAAQTQITLHAVQGRLVAERPVDVQDTIAAIASPPVTGLASGEWCPYGWGPDMPLDQREDDAQSACFDGVQLADPLALLGGATVRMELKCPTDEAILCLRLCDVSPDGVSRRITYGLANLALTDDFSALRQRGADDRITVDVRLKDTGYEVPAGHRLRLAVSTSCWPLAVGLPVVTSVDILETELSLPLASDAALRPEPTALGQASVPVYDSLREISPPRRGRITVTRHLDREETIVEVVRNLGTVDLDDVELRLRAMGSESYTMPWTDPSAAMNETWRVAQLQRPDWDIRIETGTKLGFEGTAYRFQASLDAYEGETRIFHREWEERIERPRMQAAR